MKKSVFQTIRIPVLLALMLGEMVFAVFLPTSHTFFAIFAPAILLLLPLLWMKDLWQRNISCFYVAVIAVWVYTVLFDIALRRWATGAPFVFPFVLLWGLFFARKRLFRAPEQSEAFYRRRKAGDIRFLWGSGSVIGIVLSLAYLANCPDSRWASFALPAVFLFLCGTVYCLFIQRTNTASIVDSNRDNSESGDCA